MKVTVSPVTGGVLLVVVVSLVPPVPPLDGVVVPVSPPVLPPLDWVELLVLVLPPLALVVVLEPPLPPLPPVLLPALPPVPLLPPPAHEATTKAPLRASAVKLKPIVKNFLAFMSPSRLVVFHTQQF
jgi:hypothetical protein